MPSQVISLLKSEKRLLLMNIFYVSG